jgi:hypothetical protein
MNGTVFPAAALALLVLGATGCSSHPPASNVNAGGTAASNPTSAHDKAVKFTECMRQNGVHDFPDSDASGDFPSFGISVSPTQWKQALTACKALQPAGSLSAKLTPKQLSAALKFAQCMRANGVKDFPDPVSGQPLIDTTRIPSSNRPGGMTILNAAGHKCADLLRAAMHSRS